MIEKQEETGVTTLQHPQLVLAEDVVIQAQQIAALMQLGTFLRAADLPLDSAGEVRGTQVQLVLLNPQKTTLFVNSNMIREVLEAEFHKLGAALTEAGVDLENLASAEEKRFNNLYNQQPAQS